MDETSKKNWYTVLGVVLALAAIGAAIFFIVRKPATVEMPAVEAPVLGTANVQSIDINVSSGIPAEVQVIARGTFADTCTEIDSVSQSRMGTVFSVAITTKRVGSASCVAQTVPFSRPFLLDVKDLKKGTYTVMINGVSKTFTLKADNSLVANPGGKG